MIFIVSKVTLTQGKNEPVVLHCTDHKCERCWLLKDSVGKDTAHPTICERCVDAVSASNPLSY